MQQRRLNEAKKASSPDFFLGLVQSPNDILFHSTFNKGTAFTATERDALKLRGLLPPAVQSMEVQVKSALAHLHSFETPIQKYIYLSSLKQRNETLFYRLLIENLEECMPIVYTPTVGLACQLFHQNFRVADGMYFTKQDKGHIRNILDNWYHPNVDIIVVTDGSRILGLGDLGANGMGIPIGKLSLYVAAAGFHPARTLPITLDLGTNNKDFLNDPFYLGMRHPRLEDTEYLPIVDEFMKAVTDKWPHVLVQFEDFSNEHAFGLLERYRKNYFCFNDDIQGTGAVVAAGFVNAVKMAEKKMSEQKLVFFGAGSAGIGVADAIVNAMIEIQPDLTHEQARTKFWFLDSRGLITSNREGRLEAHKVSYARKDNGDQQYKTLIDVIKYVKPTALIGLAGVDGGVFTEEIITLMGENNERPIIFALSNPTKKAECSAEDAYKHTKGRAIYASGSPFEPVTIDGKILYPSQGNNMYIFPGVGFGAVAINAKEITEKMLAISATTLANCVTEEEFKNGRLYPELHRMRDVSARVAAAVADTAFQEGVAGIERPADLLTYIKDSMFDPDYLPLGSKI
eukprot:TRINITY_DN1034_c0_g1_i1.p1 TRINITY_DN1034_c0_g1~~TRINITY_DN1034_c0_g1_i1.p1  ORF type:complete len:571 (+),score=151.17 TRINITY_DN1034_c0_g1_i1:47-1759(+)